MCDCAPLSTPKEQERMSLWLSGKDVEGFPLHSKESFKGYYTEQDYVPTDWASLAEYRAKNRRLLSEK